MNALEQMVGIDVITWLQVLIFVIILYILHKMGLFRAIYYQLKEYGEN